MKIKVVAQFSINRLAKVLMDDEVEFENLLFEMANLCADKGCTSRSRNFHALAHSMHYGDYELKGERND